MRKKILTHQKISPNTFSIKHSVGGMIDIEFLAQYFVLKHASRHNAIALFTDNIRIFESMESAQYLSKTDAETLITTYCHYRSLIYSFHFQDKPAIIEYNKIQDYSNNIIKIWREHMESVNGEKDD
jgi:glutamate-ammonia-ligase adenylyltransferase